MVLTVLFIGWSSVGLHCFLTAVFIAVLIAVQAEWMPYALTDYSGNTLPSHINPG